MGILPVFGSYQPRRGSPTRITWRDAKPTAGPGIIWEPQAHGLTRELVGRLLRNVHTASGDARCLAPPSGCSRCGWRGPGVVAALDPRLPSVTLLGSVVTRGGMAGCQAGGFARGRWGVAKKLPSLCDFVGRPVLRWSPRLSRFVADANLFDPCCLAQPEGGWRCWCPGSRWSTARRPGSRGSSLLRF
jgi:hypothetical protein